MKNILESIRAGVYGLAVGIVPGLIVGPWIARFIIWLRRSWE